LATEGGFQKSGQPDTLARKSRGFMCGLHRFDAELRIKGGWQSAILIAALVGAASLFESIPGWQLGSRLSPAKWATLCAASSICPARARPPKYALVVGDKIYVLNTSDQAVLAPARTPGCQKGQCHWCCEWDGH
jgi:hypothetical protein